MKVDRSEISKNLPKKGFRKEPSGHHIYFYHEYNGLETGVCTYISHSAKQKDVSGDLLLSMRKQLRLESIKEAVDLIKCPIDKEEFNRILIERKVFRSEPSSKKRGK
ncbi:MAG: hypothetical protein LWX51_03210 [Deltaproteobacteria bacterium]|jgi:hypothetical protein|nr:hypothetical protein [Deltaproteobacteria bacterium]